jgi:hypothetical protein
LIKSGQALPDFDYHCPLLSLPRAFNTQLESIPAEIPYLLPDPVCRARWRRRLKGLRGYRVGIVWAGRPTHGNDANRSMALESLRELLALPGTCFVSLQKGSASEQLLALPAEHRPLDLGSEIASFEDTAAILCELDELVTVDTSVAHLAGALGRPARIFLPRIPDWRWLWDRVDSPWYPTMRLYRQATRGDWSVPVQLATADITTAVISAKLRKS